MLIYTTSSDVIDAVRESREQYTDSLNDAIADNDKHLIAFYGGAIAALTAVEVIVREKERLKQAEK